MDRRPPQPGEVLSACAKLQQLSHRERGTRKRHEGDARRHYELKRIIARLEKGARWFVRLTDGDVTRSFGVTQRKLERLMLSALGFGALVELSELDVHQFFLSQRSAYMRDPKRARRMHAAITASKEANRNARGLQCVAIGAHDVLDRNYDGTKLRVTELQAPAKWMLSHLRSLAYVLNYPPEKFDAVLWDLIAQERALGRRRRQGGGSY